MNETSPGSIKVNGKYVLIKDKRSRYSMLINGMDFSPSDPCVTAGDPFTNMVLN